MRPPCLNCIIRQVGCHSKCDRYKKYRSYFKKDKSDKEYRCYLFDAIRRMKGESV